MILFMTIYPDHFDITVRGGQSQSLYTRTWEETYPSLADYWKVRLTCQNIKD